MPRPSIPLVERLERNHRVTEDGCWEWTGAQANNGYGRITIWAPARPQPRLSQGVHAVAWKLFRGPIPDGLEIDHECRNKLCFNPDHLRACTHRDNVARLA